MKRGIVGIVCGVLIGAAVGWCVRPAASSMLASHSTAAINVCQSATVGSGHFENTRAALARTLAHLAKDSSVAAGQMGGMPGFLQLVQTMAWDAPIETARMVMSAGLNESFESEALGAIARVWFGRDGSSIVRRLANEGAYDELKRFYPAVFMIVANERPFDALDPIMALDDHALRNSLFVNLTLGVSADDVPKLAQALMTLPVSDRQWIVRNIASEFASKNPDFALAWAASLTPAEAAELQDSALRTIAQSDPTRALALASGGEDRKAIEFGALEALARTDPLAAISLYEKSDDVYEKQTMVRLIAQGWGQSDPSAAAQWLLSLDATNVDVETLQSLASAWGHADIDAAAAFTNKLDERYRSAWIISASQAFMYEDTEQYLQWAEQYRSEPFYGLLLSQAVWPEERRNPEAAASYVLALDPGIRSEPLQKLIEQVSEYDPKRAAGWLSQIPDDEIRLASLDKVIQAWNYKAPDDAAQWIDSLPAGAFKDSALAALVAHSGLSDLKSLSDRISNRDTRIAALLNRGIRPEVSRELMEIFHAIALDDRQWKALETALATP